MKVVPYEFAPDDEVEMVMDSFRILFGPTVKFLRTQTVRKGSGSSAVANLPNKYVNSVATIIVWNKKERFYEAGGVLKDADGNTLSKPVVAEKAEAVEEKIATKIAAEGETDKKTSVDSPDEISATQSVE